MPDEEYAALIAREIAKVARGPRPSPSARRCGASARRICQRRSRRQAVRCDGGRGTTADIDRGRAARGRPHARGGLARGARQRAPGELRDARSPRRSSVRRPSRCATCSAHTPTPSATVSPSGAFACSRRGCSDAPPTSACLTPRLPGAEAHPVGDVYGAYLESARDRRRRRDRTRPRAGATLCDFLEQANLPEEIVRYFRLMHDFENLGAVSRPRRSAYPPPSCSTDLGSAPSRAFEGSSAELPRHAHRRATRPRRGHGDDGMLNADLIDPAVDADDATRCSPRCACAPTASSCATMAELGSDLANLKAFVRRASRPAGPAGERLVRRAAGRSEPSMFVDGYRLPLEEIARRLVERPGCAGVDPSRSWTRSVRPDRRRGVVRQLRDARRMPVGPSPCSAYIASPQGSRSACCACCSSASWQASTPTTLRARVGNVA